MFPEIRIGVTAKWLAAITVGVEGRGAPVQHADQVPVKAVRIHSASNDNQRFWIRVELGKMQPGTPVYLGFDGRWWEGGLGTTLTDSQAIFEVDRTTALEIASACSV